MKSTGIFIEDVNYNSDKLKNISFSKSVLDSVRQMSIKRNNDKDNSIIKREKDAKKLMEDILTENNDLNLILNRSELGEYESSKSRILKQKLIKSGTSVSNTHQLHNESLNQDREINRRKTSSPVPFQIVPPLNFKQNQIQININEAEINLHKNRPSLMAKTTMKLYKNELKKKQEHQDLIKRFQLRARSSNSRPPQKQIKIIKPYTNFVQLTQPFRLRNHLDYKSMTYCEQLKILQQKSSIIFKYLHNKPSINKNENFLTEKNSYSDKNFMKSLLKDAFQNDELAKKAIKELETIENNNRTDYVNQLMINGLLNFSLKSDATISSFIDWDQIDQLLLIESKS